MVVACIIVKKRVHIFQRMNLVELLEKKKGGHDVETGQANADV